MRGVDAQRAQHVGYRPESRRAAGRAAQTGRHGRRAGSPTGNFVELREARKAKRGETYRRRRLMAALLLAFGAVALVFAVFVQAKASDTAERAVPIDPNNAGPDTVLAEAAGVDISTPIRPASLTAMEPRGKNLSANAFVGLLSRGETPERIHYYIMDAAGRGGPQNGALDVGAAKGTIVYAPVTGTVTAIR